MKFLSFNINGLRAHFHQLHTIIERHKPDMIGLQETKVHNDIFPIEEIKKYGYHVSYYGQKNHYGVALLSRETPFSIRYGFLNDDEKIKSRVIIAEFSSSFGNLTVVNSYFPQGEKRSHPTKFLEKETFFINLQKYLEKKLQKDNLVLIMGDMNVSPSDLDIGIGKENRRRWLLTGKCAFLPEERKWMKRLLDWGLVDIFRYQNPNVQNVFSWFDYRSYGFNENRGLRIDLILTSLPLAKCCIKTGIDYYIRGMEKPSDHAPVWAIFKL